ncbi:MAG: hypothetical protein ACTSP9_11780, partial [Promethearchaeota archaeon]
MTLASTIPDKIPRRLLREMKKEKYDNILLFALGVYGAHKMKELVNDPNIPLENRLDEVLFQKWTNELKNSNLIKEY